MAKRSLKVALRKGAAILHLWFGLILGLYFVVIGLTGSALVFEQELLARELPELKRVEPTGNVPLPLSEIIAKLRQAYPQVPEAQLAHLRMPLASGGAYSLILWDFQKPLAQRTLTIDPYTGSIIHDHLVGKSFIGYNRALHGTLLFGIPGLLANGIGAALTSVLLLSGIWLWWPSTMKQLRMRSSVRWGAARTTYDLHNVSGIYPFVLLLVLSVTGIVLAFYGPVQKAVYSLTGTTLPQEPGDITPPADGKALPLEALIRIAEQALPEAHATSFESPTKPTDPFACQMEYSLVGFANYAEVVVNPYTGQVIHVADERKAQSGERIMRVLCNLHFGWWGGMITKMLYCLVGVTPAILFITGVLIYLRKWRLRREQAKKHLAAAAMRKAA